jgi:hypothetical protein
MDAGGGASILSTQISVAAIVVWAFQQLKKAKWFTLLRDGGQKWTQRTISIIAALFSHGGISYVWNPVLNAQGNRTLSFAIPAWSVIVLGLWHWAQQFIFQESWYQAAYNRFGLSSLASGIVEQQKAAPAAQQGS